jgi:hypothetical protein
MPFLLVLLGLAVWSLGYGVELGSAALPTVIFWDNIAFLGKLLMPPAWFVFALQYTGRARRLTHRWVVLLISLQFLTLLLIWTNGLQGIIFSSRRLDTSASFSALILTYDAGFWTMVFYNYLFLLLGTLLIGLSIQSFMRSVSLYRGQIIALLTRTGKSDFGEGDPSGPARWNQAAAGVTNTRRGKEREQRAV